MSLHTPSAEPKDWASVVAGQAAEFLVQRNIACMVAGLMILLICLGGLGRISLVTDYRNFFTPNSPDLVEAEWFAKRLSDGADTLVVIYEPASGDVFESVSSLQLARVAEAIRSMPGVIQSRSLLDQTKLVRISDAPAEVSFQERHRVTPLLFPSGLLGPEALETLKGDALSTPVLASRHVARDGSSAAITLTVDLADESVARSRQIAQLTDAIRELEQDIKGLVPGDRLRMVGSILFDRASLDVLNANARVLMPVMLGVFVLMFMFLFSGVSRALMMLFLIACSMGAGMGLAGYAGLNLTVLTFSGMMVVAILAVADALHIFSSHAVILKETPDQRQALVKSLRLNFWPILATSVTNAAGYSVLSFSPSPAVLDMGVVVFCGILAAWVFTLTFVPFLILRFPVHKTRGINFLSPLLVATGRLSIRHKKLFLAITAAATCACSLGLLKIETRDSMTTWFGPDTEFRQGLELLSSQYYSMQSFSLAVEALPSDFEAGARPAADSPLAAINLGLDEKLDSIPGLQSWLTPARALRAFETRLKDAPSSGFSIDYATLQQGGASVRPLTAAALADAGLISPAIIGQSIYAFRHADSSNASNAELVRAAESALAAAREAYPGRDVRVGGIGLTFAQLGQENLHSMLMGTVVSFIMISAMFLPAFGSLRLTLIALIPNLAPMVMVFGLWGWFVGEMNLAAITAVSVALGLIVDDTLHIIMKLNLEMKLGHCAEEAVLEALRLGAPGLVSTTLIVATGFFLLGLSDFSLTGQKAMLVCITSLVAMAVEVLILPALISVIIPRKVHPTLARDTVVIPPDPLILK
ncbi:efflux RND transporter permease subunit [Brevundimonas diminuta]|uniref:efflux RND transporter permease subunit n=1 Tax=Brevundimonas diminuta TaxID=293 RepID=UPI003CFEF673